MTRDPYAVLVSELMLQQTQVSRVTRYYEAFLTRWPDAGALAAASLAEVIEAWAGLGYNRRAVNLHRAARAIAAEGMPRTVDGLRALPGVGPYTADAIACFAYELATPVADTNIARVLARAVSGAASRRDIEPKALRAIAAKLLSSRSPRDHNLALMDLGATVCTSRAPNCSVCPIARWCAWRAAGYPRSSAPPRVRTPRFETTARFARGRIVDFLRRHPWALRDEIAGGLPEEHHHALDRHLEGLLRDGMIECDDGGFRLPH